MKGSLSASSARMARARRRCFNLITGVYRPTRRTRDFLRGSGQRTRPYRITSRGIARTFQNIRLFGSLSVFDNVRTSCNMHLHHGIAHALVRAGGFAREEADIETHILELLDIFWPGGGA